ncbi:kinase-like domain-containing protein [Pilobolus umbonatus]|nr:kinase-like domain-containing protein [Pilobolus umbonatus]
MSGEGEFPLGILRGATLDIAKLLIEVRSKGVITIGRALSNEIIVDAEFISRHHCEIFSKANDDSYDPVVYLTDKSTNGTYLNKCLIGRNKTVALFSGCIISLGSQHLNLMFIQKDSFSTVPPIINNNVVVTNSYIGMGGQAKVYFAYTKNSKYQYACRKLTGETVNYQAEIDTMKRNRHPNVMSIVRISESEKDLQMFLPFYTGGTLQDRINSEGKMTEEVARFFFYQLALGLKHIHSNEIIHLGIKPKNILLDSNIARPRIIITDFGLSMCKTSTRKLYGSDYGTYINHPPEILKNSAYNEKVDCWAAGLILCMMLTGNHPFVESVSEFNKEEVKKAILYDEPRLEDESYSECSDNVKVLIKKLLEKDPRQRGSCTDCIRSPWILENYNDCSFIKDYIEVLKNYDEERVDYFGEEPKDYKHTMTIPQWYTEEEYHTDFDPKAIDNLRKRRALSCYVQRDHLGSYKDTASTPLLRFKIPRRNSNDNGK